MSVELLYSTWIFKDGAFQLNTNVYPESANLEENKNYITVDEAKQLVSNQYNIRVVTVRNDEEYYNMLYEKKNYSIGQLIQMGFRVVSESENKLFLAARDFKNTCILYLYIFDKSICKDYKVVYDNRRIAFTTSMCVRGEEWLEYDFVIAHIKAKFNTFRMVMKEVENWLKLNGVLDIKYSYPAPDVEEPHRCTDLLHREITMGAQYSFMTS